MLCELEIPAGSHGTRKMREKECGYVIEKVANASCTRAIASQSAEVKRERKEGARRKITVLYDMRWAKRGKGMNSRSGFGSIIMKKQSSFLCHKKYWMSVLHSCKAWKKGEEAQLQKKLDQVNKSNGARCCCRMFRKRH